MWYDDYFRNWEIFDPTDSDDMEELREKTHELSRNNVEFLLRTFTTDCGEEFKALRVVSTLHDSY